MAKVRSPNYPQISLRKAVELAGRVYESAHTHKAPANTVAATLGYTGLNGASLGVLSALKKYGLLETIGEDVRISQEGLSILVEPANSVPWAQSVMRAAFRPVLFAELRKEYGDNVPKSDEFLRAFLLKRGFLPSVVDVPIRTFRDTMTLVEKAQAVLSQNKVVEEVGEVVALEDEDEAMNQAVIEAVSTGVAVPPAAPVVAPARPGPHFAGGAGHILTTAAAPEYLDEVYPLSEGRAFVLRRPAVLNEEEFEEFGDWITLLQRKLKRSISAPQTPTALPDQ